MEGMTYSQSDSSLVVSRPHHNAGIEQEGAATQLQQEEQKMMLLAHATEAITSTSPLDPSPLPISSSSSSSKPKNIPISPTYYRYVERAGGKSALAATSPVDQKYSRSSILTPKLTLGGPAVLISPMNTPPSGASEGPLLLLHLRPTSSSSTTSSASSSSTPSTASCCSSLPYRLIMPGSFEVGNHFYPRVLNAQIHPTVRYFMSLSKERIIKRYCHLHPTVSIQHLTAFLSSCPQCLRWAGCDLIHTTDAKGCKSMTVIETNSCPSGMKSCPSGMKSTPLFEEMEEEGGYRTMLQQTFLPLLPEASYRVPHGSLAVIYDKNLMESCGYACVLAQLVDEPVHLVPCCMSTISSSHQAEDEEADSGQQYYYNNTRTRFTLSGVLEILTDDGLWIPIRAALRYVTQRPWERIPLNSLTIILNPMIGCLAGGRNKGVAAKAYKVLNQRLEEQGAGLAIATPLTIPDVAKADIRGWVERLGGFAVIKVPYSNAGQGVFTITNEMELLAFERRFDTATGSHHSSSNYERFVVQSLIANHYWSSRIEGSSNVSNFFEGEGSRDWSFSATSSASSDGSTTLYHVGTMPDKRGDIFVSDLRVMVAGGLDGFRVVGIYGRKARKPLTDTLKPGQDSWAMLGTNLSVKMEQEGLFSSESERLVLMDRRDFDSTGLGLDDLIEAFVQTVLAVTAIDQMAHQLMPKGRFSLARFRQVNDDAGLLEEMMKGRRGGMMKEGSENEEEMDDDVIVLEEDEEEQEKIVVFPPVVFPHRV